MEEFFFNLCTACNSIINLEQCLAQWFLITLQVQPLKVPHVGWVCFACGWYFDSRKRRVSINVIFRSEGQKFFAHQVRNFVILLIKGLEIDNRAVGMLKNYKDSPCLLHP